MLPPPPLPPPPLPLPACGVARSGCSALLAPAGLFVTVSAPVAAPAPVVVLGVVPVAAGPEVAVLGDAPGGEEDEVAPAGVNAVAAVKSAAEVKRASFVIAHLLTGFRRTSACPGGRPCA